MSTYGIYIRCDETGRIVEIGSEGLLESLDDFIRIGEYESDVPYAQGSYFGESIIDERGVWRYCYDPENETKWRERTQDEMDADAALIVPQISATDAALIELASMTAEIMAGMAELASMIAGG